jgi:hypothetical protein
MSFINDKNPQLIYIESFRILAIESAHFEIQVTICEPWFVLREDLLMFAITRVLKPVEVLQNGSQQM